MNKKKEYSLMLLLTLSLMFILVYTQQLFREDLIEVAVSNNFSTFNEYVLGDGKYKISLPEEWSIQNEDLGKPGFLIKITDNKSIKGNITIQNNINNIKDIIDAILINNKDVSYSVYNEDNIEWHILDYYEEGLNGTYKKRCYYSIYPENRILMAEYEYEEDNYRTNIEVVFDKIVIGIK